VWPDREPSYGGRRLSEWLEDYDPTVYDSLTAVRRSEVKDAIQHIGTNALPCLLNWIRYDKPPWRAGLDRVVMSVLGNRLSWLRQDNNFIRARRATAAFRALGSQAQGAIPELDQLLNDAKTPLRAGRAAMALAYIGGEALPRLIAALTNQPPPVLYYVCMPISQIGTNARPALPTLVHLLANTNDSTASQAANTLGDSRFEPELVVPALITCLQSTGGGPRRRSAARSLECFGEKARSAVPALLQALGDSDSVLRRCASNALMVIDPKALEQLNPRATENAKKPE